MSKHKYLSWACCWLIAIELLSCRDIAFATVFLDADVDVNIYTHRTSRLNDNLTSENIDCEEIFARRVLESELTKKQATLIQEQALAIDSNDSAQLTQKNHEIAILARQKRANEIKLSFLEYIPMHIDLKPVPASDKVKFLLGQSESSLLDASWNQAKIEYRSITSRVPVIVHWDQPSTTYVEVDPTFLSPVEQSQLVARVVSGHFRSFRPQISHTIPSFAETFMLGRQLTRDFGFRIGEPPREQGIQDESIDPYDFAQPGTRFEAPSTLFPGKKVQYYPLLNPVSAPIEVFPELPPEKCQARTHRCTIFDYSKISLDLRQGQICSGGSYASPILTYVVDYLTPSLGLDDFQVRYRIGYGLSALKESVDYIENENRAIDNAAGRVDGVSIKTFIENVLGPEQVYTVSDNDFDAFMQKPDDVKRYRQAFGELYKRLNAAGAAPSKDMLVSYIGSGNVDRYKGVAGGEIKFNYGNQGRNVEIIFARGANKILVKGIMFDGQTIIRDD